MLNHPGKYQKADSVPLDVVFLFLIEKKSYGMFYWLPMNPDS